MGRVPHFISWRVVCLITTKTECLTEIFVPLENNTWLTDSFVMWAIGNHDSVSVISHSQWPEFGGHILLNICPCCRHVSQLKSLLGRLLGLEWVRWCKQGTKWIGGSCAQHRHRLLPLQPAPLRAHSLHVHAHKIHLLMWQKWKLMFIISWFQPFLISFSLMQQVSLTWHNPL